MEQFDQDLEKYRAVPIADILGIRNTGRRFAIRCPFHADTDPSMTIYPDNGFKCFGCGIHGQNAIDFIMASGKCTFKEAINELKPFI